MALHYLDNEAQQLFENPNQLLYKVMPLDRVLEMLEKQRWAFVSPTLWIDPFEKAFILAEFNHNGIKFNLPIKPKNLAGKPTYQLFATCLTETNESEAFWKTYSPNSDGIRITLKPFVLKTALSNLQNFDVYIGKALYEDYNDLYRFNGDEELWNKLNSKTINESHLNLMLKKRLPFEFENEIRILLVRKKSMSLSITKVLIKSIKELINNITLDPRMGPFVVKMVKEALVQKGFQETVIDQSNLYSTPNSKITFTNSIINSYEVW